MAGALFITTTEAKWWVIGLLLWIVCCITAAPLADQENAFLRTTTTESVMMTTEELDFKDVPIYPKEKPGVAGAAVAVSSTPPPVKYIQVLKCDTDKKVITVDNAAATHQTAETTKDIPSDSVLAVVPGENKESEQSVVKPETIITAVKTEEKNPQDSSISEAAAPSVEDEQTIKTSNSAIDAAEVNNDKNKDQQVVKIVENIKAAVAQAADVHDQQQHTNAAQVEVKPLEKIKEPETEIAIGSLTAENVPSAVAVEVASAIRPDEMKQDQPQTAAVDHHKDVQSIEQAAGTDDIVATVNQELNNIKQINNDRAPVKEMNDNRPPVGIKVAGAMDPNRKPDTEKFTPLDPELTGAVEVVDSMIQQTSDNILPETAAPDDKKDIIQTASAVGSDAMVAQDVSTDGASASDNDFKGPAEADNQIGAAPAVEENKAVESQDASSSSAMANEENANKTTADVESEVDNNKNEEFESGSEMMEAESEPVKDFTGYKVYRVTIPTEEAAAWILKFEDLPGVEFWADPKLLLRPRGFFVTSAADLLVAPDVTEAVVEAFHQARLPFEILINDLQDAIKNENPLALLSVEELMNKDGHSLTWDRYGTLDDIYSYLDFLKNTLPSFVKVTEIGKSTEGRPIYAVRLSQKGGRANKKAIFIDSGIHAREWITHATSTYMIREIVDNPDKYECLMDEFDFIFVPVINPDGYVYSHTKNRMWRKTRSQSDNIVFRRTAEESLKAERLARFDEDPILDDSILEQLRSKVMNNKASFSCTGTDANRNFDFKWLTGGSSKNPCTDTYAGSKAFSEPETQALSNYILANKDQIEMYISLHAYSQFWLLPWGYTETKPEDYSDLYSLAKIGSQALEKVNGVNYMIGTIPDLLYVASGSSIDWVKAVAGVKYAFTLELRDVGRHGFILPADKIVPSGIETWAGIYASALELASRIYSDPAQCLAI